MLQTHQGPSNTVFRARRVMRRCALLPLVVLGFGLEACGHSAAPRVLRLASSRPISKDPATALPGNLWPNSLVYRGLFQFDANMAPVPDLAVAIPSISASGREMTFTVRADARFSNGDPVTAADVSFSLRRALVRSRGSNQGWQALSSIEGAATVHRGARKTVRGLHVLGRRSIRIRLRHPDPGFLADLALPIAAVIDRRVVARGGHWWRRGAAAGPFAIDRLGPTTVLTPNRYYYGGRIKLREVSLQLASSGRAYRLFREHRLDAVQLPAAMVARYASSPLFSPTDAMTTMYLVTQAVRDRRVRVALDESLDRSRLAHPGSILDPTASVLPPTVPEVPPVVDPRVYRPAAARKILARGPAIRLSVEGTVPRVVVAWLRTSLHRAGAKLTGTGPRVSVVALNIVPPVPQRWLQQLGRAVFPSGSARFNHLLSQTSRILPSKDPNGELTADTRSQQYLLSGARLVPIGAIRLGFLISGQAQGLAPTPIGLQPVNENWSSVTVG